MTTLREYFIIAWPIIKLWFHCLLRFHCAGLLEANGIRERFCWTCYARMFKGYDQ